MSKKKPLNHLTSEVKSEKGNLLSPSTLTLKDSTKHTKSKMGPRLSHEQRRQLVLWLVDKHSLAEVVRLVKQEFGKTITRQSVWRYRNCRRWKPLIDRLQGAIERDLTKIPIANKTYRLTALQVALKEALTWRLTNVTQTGKSIYKLNVGAAIKAIETAENIMAPPTKAPVEDKEGDFHLHLTVHQRDEKRARINDFMQKNQEFLGVLLGPRDS